MKRFVIFSLFCVIFAIFSFVPAFAEEYEVVRGTPADEPPDAVKAAEAEKQPAVDLVYGDIPEISAVPAAQPESQPAPQLPVRTTIPSATTANNQPVHVVQAPAASDSGSLVSIKVNVNINGKEHVFEVSPPSRQLESQTTPGRSAVTANPALPPAAGRKIYRVQVGSFSNPAFAHEFFDKLRNTGFNPSIERYGSWYRVVIAEVNDAEIPLVVERLGIAGFTDAWVREEK